MPALETKTAVNGNVIRLRFSGRAWPYDVWASGDRMEKNCALDVGRAARG
jgi:hypothetical protein